MRKAIRLAKDMYIWGVETLWFIPYAVTDMKNVAAILPTPPWTCRNLMKFIPKKSSFIIEWGPGIGTITETMLNHLDQDSKIVSYEINSWLSKYLGRRFRGEKRLCIKNENASKIKDIESGTADVVISGIPFTFLTHDFALSILIEAYRVLKEGGVFIAYQYRSTADSALREIFNEVESYGNKAVPPMWISIAKKNRII